MDARATRPPRSPGSDGPARGLGVSVVLLEPGPTLSAEPRETSHPQALLSLPRGHTGMRHRCPPWGHILPRQQTWQHEGSWGAGLPQGLWDQEPQPPRAVLPAEATLRVAAKRAFPGVSPTAIASASSPSQGPHPGPPGSGGGGAGPATEGKGAGVTWTGDAVAATFRKCSPPPSASTFRTRTWGVCPESLLRRSCTAGARRDHLTVGDVLF